MRSVACKNDNSIHLHFLITSTYPYFSLFQEHNSATVRNISVLGGIIEQVNAEFYMQE